MQRLIAAATDKLANRQFRDGMELVSSAALNAIAGLAFWFVAARAFDEATVGVNAAVISTMAMVANFASLGMKNGLIRFLPGHPAAGSLVIRTYAVTGVLTVGFAPLIGAVLAWRIDELSALGSWRGSVGFTLACLVWIVFVLQDSVLVALRRTSLVPVSNLVYALAKLAALGVLAIAAPRWGIVWAWTGPVVAIVVWVNVVAFGLLRSPTSGRPERHSEPATGLVKFAAGEYLGLLVSMALAGLLPIFVLAELGEQANAYYTLAWTIAYTLMLVNSNIGTALLAAATHDSDRLGAQIGVASRQMGLLVIPAAIAVVLFAPLGLRVFGQNYADGGTVALRLFALGAIANIPVSIAIGVLRARRQVARMVVLYAARTLIIGGLCVALARRNGLAGVGWGWLIGESVIALAVGIAVLAGGRTTLQRAI